VIPRQHSIRYEMKILYRVYMDHFHGGVYCGREFYSGTKWLNFRLRYWFQSSRISISYRNETGTSKSFRTSIGYKIQYSNLGQCYSGQTQTPTPLQVFPVFLQTFMSVKFVWKRRRKCPDKANFVPTRLVDNSYPILDTYSTLKA